MQLESPKVKKILQYQAQMAHERSVHEDLWKSITTYLVPIRGDADRSGRNIRKLTKIYDGTGVRANSIFADGMFGHHISPANQWFRLRMQVPINIWQFPPMVRAFLQYAGEFNSLEDIPEIKVWLQDVEVGLYNEFHRSNFYSQMIPFLEDGGALGNSCLFSQEDIKNLRANFNAVNPWEIYYSENEYGEVTRVHRKYSTSVENLQSKFKGRLHPNLHDLLKTKPLTKVEVLHAVYPRENRDAQKQDTKNMPYESVWIDLKNRHLMKESGYDKAPYNIWRYKQSSHETYGWGPGYYALADVLGVNQISKDLLGAADKAVRPPLNVPSEMRDQVDIRPHGMNYYGRDHNRLIHPVDVIGQFPVGTDREDRMRQAINEAWHVDFFLMLSRSERQMTATEVMERAAEKAALLSGLSRLNYEALDPKMNWMFQWAVEAGRIPPPPPILLELGGGSITVVYMGILAQAQRRMFRSQPISLGLESLIPLAQIDPSVFDVVDVDYAGRELLEASSYPARGIRSDEEVMQIRQQRAQQQQAAIQSQQAAEQAKGVKDLSEADRNLGNPMGEQIRQLVEKNATG